MEVDTPITPPSLLHRLETGTMAEEGEVEEEEDVSLLGRLGLGLQERLGDALVPNARLRRRLKKRGKKKKAN
jgi:hypothetical protein